MFLTAVPDEATLQHAFGEAGGLVISVLIAVVIALVGAIAYLYNQQRKCEEAHADEIRDLSKEKEDVVRGLNTEMRDMSKEVIELMALVSRDMGIMATIKDRMTTLETKIDNQRCSYGQQRM